MARLFNGTSDYMTGAVDLSSTAIVTVSLRLYWDAYASDADTAIEYSDNADSGAQAFLIRPNGPGVFAIGMTGPAGSTYWTDSFTRPSAAAWHLYTFVFNRTAKVNKAWVDGVSQTLSVDSHVATLGDNYANVPLNIMRRGTGSLFGAGRMAEVAIWNHELSSGDLTSLHAGVLPRDVDAANLLLYAPICGLTSPEQSAVGTNLTVNGATFTPSPVSNPLCADPGFGFDANLGTNGVVASSTTIALTTTANARPGSRIILAVSYVNLAPVVSSVSGGSLTWVVDKEQAAADGSFHVAIISADAPAGLASGTVITVTLSGAAVYRQICGASFTGIPGGITGYTDTTAGTETAASAAWTTGNLTTSLYGDLIYAALAASPVNGSNAPVAPSTEVHDFHIPANTETVLATEYRITGGKGSYAVAGTLSPAPTVDRQPVVAVAYKRQTQLSAEFNLGTHGNTIASSDAGNGTPWDSVTIGANATCVYDNTRFHSSPLAAKIVTTTGSPCFASMNWTTSFGTYVSHYGRIYVYPQTVWFNPSAGLVYFYTGASSLVSGIGLNASLQVVVDGGTTTTAGLVMNSWNRIEWHYIQSTTVGQCEVKLFLGGNADGTTPNETLTTAANLNNGANINEVRFGVNTNDQPITVWLDDFIAGAPSYPGPRVLLPPINWKAGVGA